MPSVGGWTPPRHFCTGVMDALDTVLVGILQQILPGHGQVDLHLGGTAQICRFPMDLDVFWFTCYLPEPRELGFP